MFDIGASELLLTVIVAIVVIGPKDLPRALRLAGGWIGKVRRVSGHFRSGIEEMIRQAELEEMEKKWLEKNAEIMRQETGSDPAAEDRAAEDRAAEFDAAHQPASAEAALPSYPADEQRQIHSPADAASPELPLAAPKARP